MNSYYFLRNGKLEFFQFMLEYKRNAKFEFAFINVILLTYISNIPSHLQTITMTYPRYEVCPTLYNFMF